MPLVPFLPPMPLLPPMRPYFPRPSSLPSPTLLLPLPRPDKDHPLMLPTQPGIDA